MSTVQTPPHNPHHHRPNNSQQTRNLCREPSFLPPTTQHKHNQNSTSSCSSKVQSKFSCCNSCLVTLPLLKNKIPALKPENDVFFIIKAFAAGVILATSFIHILPEAFRDLTSPCLGEISSIFGSFSFAGFIAMCSSIGTLLLDSFATGFCKRQQRKQIVDVEGSGDGDDHLHVHVSVSAVENRDLSSSEIVRRLIVSQALTGCGRDGRESATDSDRRQIEMLNEVEVRV